MSRDNLEAVWAALALYADYNEECLETFNIITDELIARGGFTWNYKHIWGHPEFEPKLPDLIFPWDLLGRYIRGNRKKYFYPILFLTDAGTLANSIIRVIKSYIKPNDTSGDLNHQGRMIFKTLRYPTLTNWIAKKIYKLRNKPVLDEGTVPMGGAWIMVYQAYYWNPKHPPAFEHWKNMKGLL
jgi:hypothetical protein